MVLVFSLPFCLLLPDGDYLVKFSEDDTVTLNLTKVIPKIYDERLPYRGFFEGELNDVSKIKVNFPFKNKNIHTNKDHLNEIDDLGIVIFYTKKNGNRFIPQLEKSDFYLDDYYKTTNNYSSDYAIDRIKYAERHFPIEIIINGEIKKDRMGRFRYTKVKYFSNKGLHYNQEFKRAIKATNMLIDQYRVHSTEYWVTNIRENDIFIYQNMNIKSPLIRSYTKKGFTKIRKDFDMDTVSTIKKNLANAVEPLPLEIILAEAKSASEDEKYYLSVVYSITALESISKLFLRAYFEHHKVPRKILRKALKSKLFSLVTKKINTFVKSSIDENLLKELGNSINIRNRILHDNNISIKEDFAKKTLDDVNKFIILLATEINSLEAIKDYDSDLNSNINFFFSNVDSKSD